jgi:hypothetical protein
MLSMQYVLVTPLSVPEKWHDTCAGGFSVTKAKNNNTSYCRDELYEPQRGHLQAMGRGDEAPDSTPHAYIGNSWRLGRGMGASATTRCKDAINGSGGQLKQRVHARLDGYVSTNADACSSKRELFFMH